MRRDVQRAALGLLLFGSLHAAPSYGDSPPAPRVQAEQSSGVLTDAALTQWKARLASAQASERLLAAQTIASAETGEGDGEARYASWLRQDLVSPTPLLQRLIHAIWGQYPNPEYPRGPGKDCLLYTSHPDPTAP